MRTIQQKRAAFRKLHESGCFVLPNPWDVGTARMFQHLGFSALASTSAGFAWSTGRPDYGLLRDDVLEHLRVLSAATDLPVNADFESGFGATSTSYPRVFVWRSKQASRDCRSKTEISRAVPTNSMTSTGLSNACAPRAVPSTGLARTSS